MKQSGMFGWNGEDGSGTVRLLMITSWWDGEKGPGVQRRVSCSSRVSPLLIFSLLLPP